MFVHRAPERPFGRPAGASSAVGLPAGQGPAQGRDSGRRPGERLCNTWDLRNAVLAALLGGWAGEASPVGPWPGPRTVGPRDVVGSATGPTPPEQHPVRGSARSSGALLTTRSQSSTTEGTHLLSSPGRTRSSGKQGCQGLTRKHKARLSTHGQGGDPAGPPTPPHFCFAEHGTWRC